MTRRDKYDVDPSIANDRDDLAERQFSIQEHRSLQKMQQLTFHEDQQIQDENQQIFMNHLNPAAIAQTDNRNVLSWRTDPVSSFSDWTIQIIAVREDGTHSLTNFSCHSNVLAWGPRKGNFFVRLFEKQRRKSEALVSKIKMNQEEAKMIPIVLDFMYGGSTLPLSASILRVLYSLAETLDIPKLKQAMQSFVQNAMNFDQLIDFLSFVSEWNIGERLVLLAESKLFGFLVKNPKRGSLVPPKMLCRMLLRRAECISILRRRNPQKYTKTWEEQRSTIVGRIIGECCLQAVTSKKSSPSLTLRMLETMTNPGILPMIDGQTSVKLLQVQGMLVQVSQCSSEHSNKSRGNEADLLRLERRFISTLVPEWRNMMRENRPAITVAVKNFTPRALTELLLAVSDTYESGTLMSAPMSTSYLANSTTTGTFLMEDLDADVLEEMVAQVSTSKNPIGGDSCNLR